VDGTLDLVVIGTGPGGYRAGVLAALRGLEVAVVEAGDWGGCCLNRGCVPKKAWHHTARLLAAQAGFAARGIRGRLEPDLAAAWDHQERVVAAVQDSYVDYMQRLGIRAIRGRARLEGPGRVAVQTGDGRETLATRHVIVATGARPHIPPPFAPVPGRVLTTDMLFDAPPPPGRRVAVVGSGVVATEFAFILRMLGLEVAWLARSRPLHRTRFSPQALGALARALERHGVAARVGAVVERVEAGEAGVRLRLADGAEETVDWVLLGTGRVPVTEGLGLEAAGIETDARGFIRTDTRCRTGAPGVYAIGDCASPAMTANHALAGATTAVGDILAGGADGPALDAGRVPFVVYSALELARFGLDDEAAEDAGHEPAVGFAAFESNPRALGQDEADGFVRVLADMDTGSLLGAEIVGAEAGELVHALTLAPDPARALGWVAGGLYNHPARAEELLNAVETLAARWGIDVRQWQAAGDGARSA